MPNTSGIVWIRPPSVLAEKILKNEEKFLAAVFALATNLGATMWGEAKIGAPWTDRTGNARSGLFFAVEGFGQSLAKSGGEVTARVTSGAGIDTDGTRHVGKNELVIILGHTMFYGVFLELSNGERYAIVWPTMSRHIEEFMAALKEMCS